MSPPVLRDPKIGMGFKLYVAAQDHVLGAVLTQEDEGKEFPVAYLSRRLIDAKTRYNFVEKLCLSLYYAWTKFHHYLLTSSCIVISQYDVIKYMLQKPILSGRLGKWVYALVEYDLRYEPIKAAKGQVAADFIVDHCIEVEGGVCLADVEVWRLFFDGSMCIQGQGVGCVIVSPHGVEYELSIRLEFECTNNQAKYEALLVGLETLVELGAPKAELFGDSKLVVQQINGESQCFDGRLNEYREKCLHLLDRLERVSIGLVPQEENKKANTFAQQAPGYDVHRGRFEVRHRPATVDMVFALEANDRVEEPAGVIGGKFWWIISLTRVILEIRRSSIKP
jgi:ribonuclease HI